MGGFVGGSEAALSQARVGDSLSSGRTIFQSETRKPVYGSSICKAETCKTTVRARDAHFRAVDEEPMNVIAPIVLILGGILALSGLIVAKKPDAKELINKLVPYQGAIGVALLLFGVLNLMNAIRVLKIASQAPVMAISILGVVVCSVLLGLLFGIPLIAKWIPGQSSAEQKVAEISAKIASFQVIIGMAGIVASLLALLFRFSILGPM
jgi:hypothetical protein